MNPFSRELRKIRKERKLLKGQFAKELGIAASTYTAVESGRTSERAPSVQSMLNSGAFTPEEKSRLLNLVEAGQAEGLTKQEKQRLKRFTKKVRKKKFDIKITDADRAAYQGRKNAKHFNERAERRGSGDKEFKRAIPKTVTQKIFY